MFDISFSEFILVFIVGLVVLGPQRLPVAIRTVMGWIRALRGLVANVQNELSQELKLQELQESIKKAEQLNLSKLSPELSKTVEELKQSAQKMHEGLDVAKADFEALTKTQVADIQNKIENESEQLASQANLQNATENRPLVNDELAQGSGENGDETTGETLSADELAELAEADESQLAYYPPDDDLATPSSQDKKNVS